MSAAEKLDPAPEVLLDIENVSLSFGGVKAIRDVSFDIHKGEIRAIIGPNGAGKSTAMKAVFGMLTISAGSIALAGREITNMPPDQVVAEGVCYVPQVGNVFINLTVQENLEMGAYLRRDDIRPRRDEIFAMFPDLAEKRRQPAGSLSGGQRQMVAMGRALMLEPKILMLDEPTAGLSPKYRGEIFETVKRINATGVPILMVEQNAKQALGIADRAYVLVDGENRVEGSGADLLADREVARMFLGAKA